MKLKTYNGNVLVYSLIVLLLIVILLAVTNPDKERHIQVISDILADQDAISSVLNRGILSIDPPAYHTAVVFSYTKRKSKLTSLGFLNYIWVDKKAF